jgi:hypothetical protein
MNEMFLIARCHASIAVCQMIKAPAKLHISYQFRLVLLSYLTAAAQRHCIYQRSVILLKAMTGLQSISIQ